MADAHVVMEFHERRIDAFERRATTLLATSGTILAIPSVALTTQSAVTVGAP
jgi:hypothetical protein